MALCVFRIFLQAVAYVYSAYGTVLWVCTCVLILRILFCNLLFSFNIVLSKSATLAHLALFPSFELLCHVLSCETPSLSCAFLCSGRRDCFWLVTNALLKSACLCIGACACLSRMLTDGVAG
jgi:hypothetical protein